MNALARYIQRFDAEEVAPPADLVPPMPTDRPVAEPAPDRAAEAEAEGRRQGRAEAERAFAAQLAAERDGFARRLLDERARWSAEEGERLAEALAGAALHLETVLSEAASRALLPFLTTAARERAIADLCATLGTLLSDGKTPAISISGPRDLVMEIATRLGPKAEGIAFEPGRTSDVRVVADSTIIETRFTTWVSRLAAPLD